MTTFKWFHEKTKLFFFYLNKKNDIFVKVEADLNIVLVNGHAYSLKASRRGQVIQNHGLYRRRAGREAPEVSIYARTFIWPTGFGVKN